MLRNAGKDIPASPESEQLLSVRIPGDTADIHARLQPGEDRWSSDETYPQDGGVSSSTRMTSRDKPAGLNAAGISQTGETSDNPAAVAINPPRFSSAIADDNQYDNDDPPPYASILPPYSAIAPSDHWPYGIFSFGHSTDRTPLALLQAAPPGFHLEGTDDQFPSALTSYQFVKFGCRGNIVPRETFPDDGIAEKIDDTKSRRYGAILVAAAVIIFLMALSLMVRFVMEKSWWRS